MKIIFTFLILTLAFFSNAEDLGSGESEQVDLDEAYRLMDLAPVDSGDWEVCEVEIGGKCYEIEDGVVIVEATTLSQPNVELYDVEGDDLAESKLEKPTE